MSIIWRYTKCIVSTLLGTASRAGHVLITSCSRAGWHLLVDRRSPSAGWSDWSNQRLQQSVTNNQRLLQSVTAAISDCSNQRSQKSVTAPISNCVNQLLYQTVTINQWLHQSATASSTDYQSVTSAISNCINQQLHQTVTINQWLQSATASNSDHQSVTTAIRGCINRLLHQAVTINQWLHQSMAVSISDWESIPGIQLLRKITRPWFCSITAVKVRQKQFQYVMKS